jgi:hypothetical protein
MGYKSDRQYINDLAKTVNELFFDDVYAPNAEQIARAYYGEDKVIVDAVVDDVRRRLGRVRRALEQDGHETAPLSETYYRRFRRNPPKTRDEARTCLAIGRNRPQVGILLLTGVDESTDIIWEEWISLQRNQAAGKEKRVKTHVLRAVSADKLSIAKAEEIEAEAVRIAQPDQLQIAPGEPSLPELASA